LTIKSAFGSKPVVGRGRQRRQQLKQTQTLSLSPLGPWPPATRLKLGCRVAMKGEKSILSPPSRHSHPHATLPESIPSQIRSLWVRASGEVHMLAVRWSGCDSRLPKPVNPHLNSLRGTCLSGKGANAKPSLLGKLQSARIILRQLPNHLVPLYKSLSILLDYKREFSVSVSLSVCARCGQPLARRATSIYLSELQEFRVGNPY